MPRTHSLAWAELKFGIIAVFALIMAGLVLGVMWPRFKQWTAK